MNIFVLCTGRCGSTTFVRACSHIENYTAAHESRTHLVGPTRFEYPSDHIEVDNRLSWFLGGLDKSFGDNAFYVHLLRDREATAQSFSKRIDEGGIAKAFDQVILRPQNIDEWKIRSRKPTLKKEKMGVCRDYYDTINSNIELFLKDKSHTMQFRLEKAKEDFELFWHQIGAVGDLEAAKTNWDIRYNASTSEVAPSHFDKKRLFLKIYDKCKRVVYGFPQFIRDA
jgi:hypothetical protein